MPKILRISTIPTSLNTFCRGQLHWLSEKGYEVVAVSSQGEELDEIASREGVRTIAVPMQRHISIFNDIKSLFAMIRVMRRERPDIVHSITPKAGLISMMAAWLTRVPVRMHTYTGLVFPTATGFKQRILIAMDRLLCFCATFINPEGRGVANDLKQYHITKKPLHIIDNGNVRGIDKDYWNREAVGGGSWNLPTENEPFTMLMVSRLVGDKGINELVEAFIRLYDERQDVRLLLVGRFEHELDPLADATVKAIAECPGIELVGQQSDVRPWYAKAHAFIFPSYREGFPNTVLEAGAMGLPCVVTDINGCNEIIENGQNGLIIPTHNTDAIYSAMRQLLENPEATKQMALNARPMVINRYEQQALWNSLLETYNKLTASRK